MGREGGGYDAVTFCISQTTRCFAVLMGQLLWFFCLVFCDFLATAIILFFIIIIKFPDRTDSYKKPERSSRPLSFYYGKPIRFLYLTFHNSSRKAW